MDNKRKTLIDDAVNALYQTNRIQGFTVISIETLKLIMQEYIRKYQPPRNPGTLPAGTSEKIRSVNHEMHKLPSMYHCEKCNKYNQQADMAIVNPAPVYGKGICNECYDKSKADEKNVIKVNFKR